jgi:NAD(P)H-hydrate epimerase
MGKIADLAADAGPDCALVDGAGDANAPGVEQEFATAVREATTQGLAVRLEPSTGYRPPRPSRADTLFSPEAAPRSREDVRLMDSTAMNHYFIPGIVLMENAGWRTAREAYASLGFDGAGKKVVVAAGAGNNGGDGFVAARHLAAWDVPVEIVLASSRERTMDDAGTNLDLAEIADIRIAEAPIPEIIEPVLTDAMKGAALVVDALVGTGLSGKVRGAIGRAVELINEAHVDVLAVDTPSGLDANTGEILGAAVRANRTVTFAFTKPGFFLADGPRHVGELAVADISLPRALWATS